MLDGLKEMFMRTQFVSDQGGYFPEIKAHPEKYIMKRRPQFRDWLKMLRQNGKFLYVITGERIDSSKILTKNIQEAMWTSPRMWLRTHSAKTGRQHGIYICANHKHFQEGSF